MQAKDILVKKRYPDGYPDDVVDTLNLMSLTHGKKMKLAGSMPLRSQLYAGDYDAVEIVEIGGERQTAVTKAVDVRQQRWRDCRTEERVGWLRCTGLA